MKRKTYERTLSASFKALFPDAPVSSNALFALEIQDLKDSYRRLAKKYHPDVSGGNAAHARTFADIAASYEVLTSFIVERKKNAEKVTAHQRSASPHSTQQSKKAHHPVRGRQARIGVFPKARMNPEPQRKVSSRRLRAFRQRLPRHRDATLESHRHSCTIPRLIRE